MVVVTVAKRQRVWVPDKTAIQPSGELVGIHKLSNRFYKQAISEYQLLLTFQKGISGELTPEATMNVLKIDGLKWYEIEAMNVPYRPRKKHERSFLKYIQLVFNFSDSELFKTNLNEFASSLKDYGYVKDLTETDNTIVRKNNGFIAFRNNSFTIVQEASEYVSFDNFQLLIEKILTKAYSFGLFNVDSIIFLKSNSYIFAKDEPISSLNETMIENFLFSKSFLNQGKVAVRDANASDNVVIIAMRKFDESDKRYMEELQVCGCFMNSCKFDDIKATLTDVNNKIYNIWYWAMSEQMRKLLDKKEV